MRNFFFSFVLFGLPIFAAFPDICVKCWYEVPNSNLSSVYQTPAPPPSGTAGYHNIMSAASGAAYDVRKNRLIIAGAGGGSSYAGNEVYAFDIDSLKWFRIKDATSQYDKQDTLFAYYLNGGAVPDSQQPRPGATYDQIEYDSTTNGIYIFGVSFAYWNMTQHANIHRLEMDSLTWSHAGDVHSSLDYGGSLSARDPATGKIWFLGNGEGAFISSYMPSTRTVTDHGNPMFADAVPVGQTAAIMPSTNRFISVGKEKAYYWNLVTSGNSERATLTTTGCDSLKAKKAPGFEWSTVDRKMVGWGGGTHVITMDSTYTCVDVAPSASNTVNPSLPQSYGTYGRWRYIPKYNVFAVVNSTTGSVYFYRHSAEPPVITQGPQGASAYVGQTVTLGVEVIGTQTLNYQWRKNGANISGATSGSYTTPTLVLGNNGDQYSVIVSNVAGADTSAEATISVTTSSPVVVEITNPSTGYSTNQGTMSVSWTVDGVAQTSQTSEVLDDEGANLVVRCSNSVCDTISVTRDQTPPIVAITSPSEGYLTNQTGITIAWTIDGVTQTMENSETLSVEGTNTVTRSATDAVGNFGSDTIHVTRDTLPPVVVVTLPQNGDTVCSSPVDVYHTLDGVSQSSFSLALHAGLDTIRVQSTDASGNTGRDSVIVFRMVAPIVQISSPSDSAYTQASSIPVAWTTDGTTQTTGTTASLTTGLNIIVRTKTNACGATGVDTVRVFRDNLPPVLALISPLQGTIILEDSVVIRWSADGVEQTSIHHAMDTSMANYILLKKTDLAGNRDSLMVTFYAGTRSPNVIGLYKVQAESLVTDHALLPLGKWVDNDTVPTGEVFAQTPVENDTIQYRHPVRYSLSRGPEAVDLIPVSFDADSVTVNPLTLAASGHTHLILGNVGRGPVADSFAVLVFEDRNRDSHYTEGNDLFLGQTMLHDSLAAGDSLSLDINVEGILTFNGNRLTVALDYGDQITEVDEANNVSHTMARCRKLPDTVDYVPRLKWAWFDSTLTNLGKVISTPVVAQMSDDNGDGKIDGDDMPDVVVAILNGYTGTDKMMALDGRTGHELWKVDCKITEKNTPAVGDIDGDGKPEVVLFEQDPLLLGVRRILVLDDTGGRKAAGEWHSFGSVVFYKDAIALNDLDGDGKAEIMWGINIHDYNARLVYPRNFVHSYVKVAAADLDRDGYQELYGQMVPPGETNAKLSIVSFKEKRFISSSSNVNLQNILDPMLARFSDSANPSMLYHEIGVVDSIGHVRYVSTGLVAQGGVPAAIISNPGFTSNNEDGHSDNYFFGSNSARLHYAVGSMGTSGGLQPYFSRTDLRDSSISYRILSNVGNTYARGTIFDLNDDGNPEVFLQAIDTLYVLNPAGAILARAPFKRHHQAAGVTVADLDRDNHADVVITSSEGFVPTQRTVAVYSNPTWVGARPIFPGREYTVTNINDDGSIPRFPAPYWENNNTVNMQCAQGNYACMDLSASFPQLVVSGGDTLITARIGNGGVVELPAGLRVSFYVSHGGPDSLMATVTLPGRLKPGAFTTVQTEIPAMVRGLYTFHIAADDSGNGHGDLDESSESNNSVSLAAMLRNRTPAMTVPDDQFAAPEVEFTYPIDAEDLDGDDLTYSLLRSPSGMTINGSGVIHWTPAFNPPRCTVEVAVSDPYQGQTSASFMIFVDDGTNQPPVISSSPDTLAVLHTISSSSLTVYRYRIEAEDPEDEWIEYKLNCVNCGSRPGPAILGDSLTWAAFQPPWTVSDSAVLQVRAIDARGAVDTQTWVVRFHRLDNTPPVFSSIPDTSAAEDQPWKSPVSVFDLDDDVVTLFLDTIPLGMSLSNDSLRWTPSVPGAYVVRIGATDGIDTTWQSFVITVAPTNDAPRIVSSALTGAVAGAVYSYQVIATDEDGDELDYSLAQAPSGMTISAEGLIQWTPSQSQTASVNVEVVAKDPSNADDNQSFTLQMVPDTVKPVVMINFSKNPAQPGTAVTVSLQVGDNVDVETSSLTLNGTLVTLTEGLYTFTPSSVGTYRFAGQAEDPSSNVGTTSGILRVSNAADLTPPNVTIAYSPEEPDAGETVTFTVTVTDTDGVDASRIWVEVDGVSIRVEGGAAEYTARRPGELVAKAVAYDSLGASAISTVAFTVFPLTGDAVPPTASLTSPEEDSVLFGKVEVQGTASDANLAYYTLSYRDLNTAIWTEYFRSTSSVTADSLGYIDATTLPNGDYEIRLDVHDRAGNYTTQSVKMQVAGEKKAGNFTLAFQDLSIPMSGMELAVTRTYDSRVKTRSDFGMGWQMGMRSIALHENRNQGVDWAIRRTPGLIPNYYFEEGKHHTVTVTLPGGRKQEFVPEPQFFSPFNPTYGVMAYRAKPGTYSTLKAVAVDTFVVMGGELYDERGDLEEPFNPQVYKITLLDSSYLIYDQASGGVLESGDANGNVVTWEGNAIRHDAGPRIDFARDSLGRITSISDSAGRGMQYRYDVVGNLGEVLDAEGHSTRFRYGPKHYLEEIIDGRGVRAARTEYDDEGRMVRQINANGDTLKLTHNQAANTEEIEDFKGRVTTYTYDDRGNILTKTDDAENTWSYAYDSVGNLLSTTQPGGGTRSSTFDDHGNELTSTDELENTTTRTYDTEGHVLTSEDPLGRITEYEYDTRGNLLRETGPDNVVQSERTFDSRGNLLTEENALGFVTTHTYNGFGWSTSTTDALGRVSAYGHDGAGNTILEVNASGDTTRHAYDGNGNRLMTINPAGDTIRSEYNVISKLTRQVDALGHATQFVYNALGDKVLDISPDSAETGREYDAAGNVAAIIDPMGRRVEMEYDHENRLLRTIFGVGQFTENTYDALGRRASTRDANGNVTQYEYDDTGRDTAVIDAGGNVTSYEYDLAGRKSAMVDALGMRTEYAYDAYDRPTITTFANGTTRVLGYDAAGRKISEIDQAGKTTLFEYDSLGNLTAVVDALDNRTEYTYDENNNRLTQKDAKNHTTSMVYDILGRMVRRTYPNADQERWGYDPNGNARFHVKGADSTEFEFDASNREVRRKHFNSGHEVFTSYALDGKRDTVVDYRGVTTYAYDTRGRLFKEVMPNDDFIENHYDSQGNRTSLITPFGETRYGYDAHNRMDSVTSPQNAVTVYRYNPVGNRDSVLYPNGTSVGYSYDSLHRLTEVRNWSGVDTLLSRYIYTLNPAGVRTAVEELDSSVVAYAYDDLYRLLGETRTGSHAYVRTYAYDDVGNRLTQVVGVDTTVYEYNSRDQLMEEDGPSSTTTYDYDAAGRMISKDGGSGTTTYFWADEDRLDSISGPGVGIGYTYDADGRKVKETTPDTVRQFLIDRLLPYGQVILETDGAGDMVAEYVYGLERVSQERGGVTHWYLADGQGSVRQLADSNGFVSDTYAYTAFGEPLASTGTTTNDFRYVGEQLDGNSGFYYNRARWMDPGTGRFVGVDPFNGNPHSPLSLHRYLYANASPVNFTDPTGHFSFMQAVNVVATISTLYGIAHGSYKIGEGDIASGSIEVGLSFMGIGVWKSSFGFVRYLASPLNKSIRLSYLKVLGNEIPQSISSLRAAGQSSGEIAEAILTMRNSAKAVAWAKMAAEGGVFGKAAVKLIQARNFFKYGNSAGPDVIYYLKQGKGYEDIIESAVRASQEVNAFLGVL